MRIIRDGSDPLTKPLVDYLADKYGMPAGDIRRLQLDCPVGDVQTLTVTLVVDPAIPGRTAAVPLLDVPMRDEQPARPYSALDTVVMTDPAATAVLERPASRAPTNCVWRGPAGPHILECGEVIRFDPELHAWYHVSDKQLGPSQHPATPGQ